MKTKALLFSFILFVFVFCIILRSTANAANKIMPLGDSITWGFSSGVDLEEFQVSYRKALYDKLKTAGYVVNQEVFVGTLFSGESVADFDPDHDGHLGWRADEIVAGRTGSGEGQLSDWLITEAPNIVLLHIGTNDIAGGNEDWNEVEDILVVIDDYESASGNAVWVILALIIDRSCDPYLPPCPKSQETTDFNDDVRNFVFFPRQAGGDKILLVDMQNGAGINYDRWNMGGDMWDDLHPFETGYAKMADLWFSALMDIMPQINCELPVGHLDYCRDCGPCAVGQGDCDNDGECQSGLTCVPDLQVPGTDICQAPPPVCPHPVGHLDYCRDCGPCTEGEGDCDDNSECESGLTCVQIPGVDTCQSDVCTLPVGHLDYCRDCGPCAEDEGDCDSDSECQSGLTCVQVPGVDTCRSDVCTLPVGHLDYCRDCGPCAEDEGDCDSDSECQSGLTCVQIPGVDTCRSDVCTLPVGHLDYCRDCGPCDAGQGDCDNDGECQSGLVCEQIPGVDACVAP